MGYGRRALDLLKKYYEGAMPYPEEDNTQHEIQPVEPSNVGLLEERIGESHINHHLSQFHPQQT